MYIEQMFAEGINMKKKRLRIANKFRFTVFMIIVSFVMISSIATVIGLNTAESADIPQYIEISVEDGDTLWDLAKEYGPSHVDTRKTIYEVSLLNDLEDNYIYPGQVIKFPVYN